MLSPRSGSVGRHSLFNHVAPSGYLQPPRGRDDLWSTWFSTRRTLLSEFAEELYGREKAPSEPDSLPEIARLSELIAGGGATLLYTGVSVNLLMLRPEVCLTLYVRDEDWLRREIAIPDSGFRLGLEFLSASAAAELPADRVHLPYLGLDDDLQPIGNERELWPSALVPQAAASMHLAVEAIRELDGR